MLKFKCPVCSNEMEQESQAEHSINGVSTCYDYDKKEWIIPNEILMEYKRSFWCKNDSCSMKNRFVFYDGNYKYVLSKEKWS